MNILQIQAELLRQEYPQLLPGEDPDIERYFLLRNSGRSREALALYQLRLRPRYPNDEFRTMLLSLYRRRDPAYRGLQARAYQALGLRCLEKLKRVIVFVADRSDAYNPRDAYSTIKAAELIKQILPRERYEAVAAMERLFRYSLALNLRTQALQRATELIRAYLSDTLAVVDEERRRREEIRKRAMAERRRQSEPAPGVRSPKDKPTAFGDLMDAVVFSPADLANIEIPRALVRPEDKTLAFCTKYWNRAEDQAFERLLFLYSRKFGVKNYDVFKAVQRGRQNGKRDDEILAAVMSCVITGYYYSVMGDRYLQRQWAAIKARLASSAENPAAAPASAAKPTASASPSAPPKPAAPPAAARPAPPAAAPGPVVPPPAPVSAAKPTALASPVAPPKSAAPPAAARPAPPAVASGPVVPATAPVSAAKPTASASPAAPPKPAAPPVATRPAPPAAAPGPAAPAATEKPRQSVSERLQELSGRSYDVFQDRFLAHVRSAIRKMLGANRGIFFTVPLQAEDIVFNFLKAHYSDPYMNWEESSERTSLSEIGFELKSLTPVIDECYKML
jgi:hypothetical protein